MERIGQHEKEQGQGRITLETTTPWRNKLFVLVFYHFLRLSPRKIADFLSELDISVAGMTIDRTAKKMNLSRTPNEMYVCIYYLVIGYSANDIAKIFDSSQRTVFRILERNGFELCLPADARRLAFQRNLPKRYDIPWRNKLFLLVFYHFLRMSTQKISDLLTEFDIRVTRRRIARTLKKLDLTRTPNEMYVCIYYLVLGYSTYDIAKIFDSSPSTVFRILERNVETRSITDGTRLAFMRNLSERYDFPITFEFRELLYGSIAADGTMPSGLYTTGYKIVQKWTRREYLLHCIAPIAEASGYSVTIREEQKVIYNDDNDTATITVLTTNYSIQLKELEEKFYRELTPEEKELYPYRTRMKILPPDIFITPRVALYLYLEDGSLYQCSTSNHWHVEISTHNFERPDVQRLCDLLITEIGDNGIKPYREKAREVQCANGKTIIPKKDEYYKIVFSAEASRKFFDYIGWESPVACFAYKYPPKPAT